MDIESTRHIATEVTALVQEQMQDLKKVTERRAALTAKGAAADGMVSVTLDANHTIIETVIDEDYLSDHELTDLGAHVTAAARQAAEQLNEAAAALLAPMVERRTAMSAAARMIGLSDIEEMMSQMGLDLPTRGGVGPSADEDDGQHKNSYPVVRG
ncbi:YbaB/EbfC family nucleoid-associated protein [Mycobacterium sp. 3519A]|uniref:YbaB/EbfC family nucleoid-associated protein n=1 Tax=Mycobacterium sp. 3519A TaxID=2057184 RepID=UPI000C7DB2FF|nr:YbaB/EbfC family nucleoid-associated protein [Mycobacterium sp. 3519A]